MLITKEMVFGRREYTVAKDERKEKVEQAMLEMETPKYTWTRDTLAQTMERYR